MKKLTTVSLFIFGVITTAILVAGLVFYQDKKNNQATQGQANLTGDFSGQSESANLMTIAEIAKHNSANDCWLLIENKIYNVSKYVASHPGGVEAIIAYCGRDASQAFATKGGKNVPHSDFAKDLLTKYYLGGLNQPRSQAPAGPDNQAEIGNSANQAINVPPKPDSVKLNLTELAKHNSANDCWLLIENKIYNVSKYVASHPGGVEAIIAYCGRDASQAFATKGGKNAPHSSNAQALLSKYFIGDFNQAVSPAQLSPAQSNPSLTAPINQGEDRENEAEDD